MSRIEKQFALMELQFLLGDHRAADRRQAEALVVGISAACHICTHCRRRPVLMCPLGHDFKQ